MATLPPIPGRRVSARLRLAPPIEVRLVLGDQSVQGWVVDQQDDGLGLRFGSDDAERLLRDPEAWREGPLGLQMPGLEAPQERLPVSLVHVTPGSGGRRECIVGLIYDRRRMKPDQVARLLDLWARFEAASR